MTRPPILSFIAGAGDVIADLDRLMEFGAFVEGTSRSGKTNLVRVFLEQTYGLVQHIVLDIEGEYATLRSSERPYLIVGNGRDVALPAEPDAIRRFVLAIVEKGVSVIFDLSEHDTEEQHTIVAAVCDALVSLPENHPGAAAVVLEEMQEFAPEGGGKGTALASVKRLSKRGLKRGFFIVGASQRVSDVSKGIVTQLKTKMIGGTDHKDAPRALEELGLPTRDRQAVTDLAQGEFWVKGPAFDRHAQHVRVPRSVTAPPKRKRGDPPAPAPEAPAEIAALAAALAASVAKELPVDAPDAPTSAPPTSSKASRTGVSMAVMNPPLQPLAYDERLQRVRDDARFEEAQRQDRYRRAIRTECEMAIAGLRTLRTDLEREFTALLSAALDDVDESIGRFESAITGVDEEWMKPVAPDPAAPSTGLILPMRAPTPAERAPKLRLEVSAAAASSVGGTAARILNAIGFFDAMGQPEPTKKAVAALAGVSISGGSWATWMSQLRVPGLITDPAKNRVAITDAGRALVDRSEFPTSHAALHRAWLEKLEGKPREMLTALLAVYPAAMEKSALAAHVRVSITGGSWSTWLSKLRVPGLIEDVSRTEVRAAATLFPEGLQ